MVGFSSYLYISFITIFSMDLKGLILMDLFLHTTRLIHKHATSIVQHEVFMNSCLYLIPSQSGYFHYFRLPVISIVARCGPILSPDSVRYTCFEGSVLIVKMYGLMSCMLWMVCVVIAFIRVCMVWINYILFWLRCVLIWYWSINAAHYVGRATSILCLDVEGLLRYMSKVILRLAIIYHYVRIDHFIGLDNHRIIYYFLCESWCFLNRKCIMLAKGARHIIVRAHLHIHIHAHTRYVFENIFELIYNY